MSEPLNWIPIPAVTKTGSERVYRRQWDLYIAKNVYVTVFLRGDEYFAQCTVRSMPILGKTYKGDFLGMKDDISLEAAQAAALGKAHDELSDVLQSVERAMYSSGHEVEPLVPDGALDHRGMP